MVNHWDIFLSLHNFDWLFTFVISNITQIVHGNIEHLWEHLKCRLRQYETPPKGVHELWDRVSEEWNEISPEICQNLIESMPRRIQAVIKAKGGHTKY